MTADEALTYIHSFCWKGAIPGLSRTYDLLDRIGNPQKRLKFVHIVGTNGKGSTAAMIASVLQKAGYTTGLYTSPYLIRFHERMQVNGQQITDQELADITSFVQPHAEAMADHPTEFELVTAIAFEYFARRNCQIVVLEAGMGGALDSTNVIDAPEVAVFTNIGLDHTEYLGDTVEKIAATKAGIIKEGSCAVCYRSTESVEQVYEDICKAHHVPLTKADFASIVSKSHSLEGQTFDYQERKDLFLPLLGDHQLHNAAVAISALDALAGRGWNISEEQLRQGLAQVRWPGRFDLVRRDPLFIIDGGHNPQCIAALAQNIRDYLPGKPLTMLTGVLADKDYGKMFSYVAPFATRFVTVTPPNPRRLPAEALAESLKVYGKPVTAASSIEEGVRLALEQTEQDGAVLAFGSLYMLADIRAAAEKKA